MEQPVTTSFLSRKVQQTDLDDGALKFGNDDDHSKILMFILKMSQLDHIVRDPTNHQFN
jgi:hypothetical protein